MKKAGSIQHLKLPNQIGEYLLKEEMSKDVKTTEYITGIYIKRGRKYFAKVLYKTSHRYPIYAIKNEIKIYQILNNLGKNYDYRKYKDIKIPKFIECIEDWEIIAFITEYIEGKEFNLNSKNNFEAYLKIIDYFSHLYTLMDKKTKKEIPKRSPLIVVLIYYIVLVKAVARKPGMYKDLLKAAYIFTRSIPNLLRNKSLTFVHRDLVAGNIRMKNNEFYIVDFQISTITNPVHEFTHTLRDFTGKELVGKIFKRFSESKEKDLFVASLIYSMTHAISSHNDRPSSIAWWGEMLRKSIKLSYEK